MMRKLPLPFSAFVIICFLLTASIANFVYAGDSGTANQLTTDSSLITPHISVGGTHSVYLSGSGTVWTFGNNDYGQLGDGSFTNKSTRLQINELTEIKYITAGLAHSTALKSDGTVWAWGNNSSGQLGDRTDIGRNSPVQVTNLCDATAIASGGLHTLALKNDGTVWAWGDNTFGQLGDGSLNNKFYPVQVYGLTGIVAISAGDNHSLALDSKGNIWAWGNNTSGQLGIGTTENSAYPVAVTAVSNVKTISAGGCQSIALLEDGTVYSWGDNSYGQLGDGTITPHSIPVLLNSLEGIVSISAGEYHSLFLKSDGTLVGCGSNSNLQLGAGYGSKQLSPVRICGVANVKSMSAGGYHSLAIDSNNILWAWGWNYFGQLGDGTTLNRSVPVMVQNPPNNAPVFDTISDKTVDEGQLLEFTINAFDPDDNLLTYSTGVLPNGSRFDPVTRIFSWTPDYTQAASYSPIHFEVSDGTLSDSIDIMITVNNVNRPPVANAGPDQTFTADLSGEVSVELDGSSSFDPDGDNLIYTWTGAFGTVSGQKTTVKLPIGENTITLITNDGQLESSDEIKINVVPQCTTGTIINNGFSIGTGYINIIDPESPNRGYSYFRYMVIRSNEHLAGTLIFSYRGSNIILKSERIDNISLDKGMVEFSGLGYIYGYSGKYSFSVKCIKSSDTRGPDKISIEVRQQSNIQSAPIYQALNQSIVSGNVFIMTY